jgi:hypothetical protein
MRVTRDQRGYETTFLLHTPRVGERPRVLYWYRTAPGLRIGRRALDEDAIRALEEQYPEIEFDWPQLLEEAESVPPDVERRPERPRRRPPPPEPELEPPPRPEPPASVAERPMPEEAAPARAIAPAAPPPGSPAVPSLARPRERNPLLEQLVGREIAARLRARYAEVVERLRGVGEVGREWEERAAAIDPDGWEGAEEILRGVERAGRAFEELTREVEEWEQRTKN